MKNKGLLLALCVIQAAVVSGLTLDHIFGPVVEVKSTPRSVVPSSDGNFVEFSDINDGCGGFGTFDFIRVSEYNIATQVGNITRLWHYDLPCGTQQEVFLASYYDQTTGDTFFLTVVNNAIFSAYQVSSTGIVSLGAFSDSTFSLTNAGLVVLGPVVLVYNANMVRTLDGVATYTAPPGDSYWGGVSDGSDIFVLGGSSSSSSYYLAKISYALGSSTISLTQTFVSPTLQSAVPFGADDLATVVTFFYVQPLSFCADDLRVVFTNTAKSKYEVFSLSTTSLLVDGHFAETSLNQVDQHLVGLGCNKISGRSYSLVEQAATVNGDIQFSYYVYFYQDMVLNDTFPIEMGPTALNIPRYIAVMASPLGDLYVHREAQQSINTFSELYGQIFTNCPPDTFGPNCEPCLCIGGVCDAGEAGTGECLYCDSQTLYGPYCNNTCACLIPSNSSPSVSLPGPKCRSLISYLGPFSYSVQQWHNRDGTVFLSRPAGDRLRLPAL